MKLFFLYGLKLIVLVILVLYGLDLLYTRIYNNKTSRNKIEWVLNTKNEKFDIIVLGSSRANNHIIPKAFIDKNLSAFNLGMSGASLEENLILFELLIENNKVKNLLLEVDLNINRDTYSEGSRVSFLPFINSSETINKFYKKRIDKFYWYANIPFYRYVVNDSKIGLRNVFFKAIRKGTKHLDNYGFHALSGNLKSLKYDISSYQPSKNASYESIKKLCFDNDIKLLSFTTPICKETKGRSYFNDINDIYPEILNLENIVTDDKYFYTCGHMNVNGATLFTNYLITNFF